MYFMSVNVFIPIFLNLGQCMDFHHFNIGAYIKLWLFLIRNNNIGFMVILMVFPSCNP